MSEIVNQSLQKIAKGTGIILIGTIIGMLLGFVSRIITVRYITQSEYGIFSLALVLMNIFVTISTLGLEEGAVRYIAYFRGKNEDGKVRGIISSSIKIALVASVIFSLILFLLADIISRNIFHTSELSTPLKIFSTAIPFTVLISIFASIFRGFDRVEPYVCFQNIMRNVAFILFLVTVALLGLSFPGVIYAYLASITFTCIAFATYTLKKLPISLKGRENTKAGSMGKELLLFSLPLLGPSVLGTIMSWADILMLGYFKMPDAVGLYNTALPLANLLPIFLSSVNFLYLPIMSQLYAERQMEELKRSYAILTKWIFAASLPVFLTLFLFPEAVLNLLFGSRYIGAAIALQILGVGFFTHTIFGPNGNTLIVMGKTRFFMCSILITVIVNIILNIVLIPPLGIIGAAIATASALAIKNIFWAIRLYSPFKIHPFTKNYLKPMISSTILVLIFYVLVKNLFSTIPLWLLPILFILFSGTHALSVLFTRSFDKEDITMLLAIEERFGFNLTPIKSILNRFI